MSSVDRRLIQLQKRTRLAADIANRQKTLASNGHVGKRDIYQILESSFLSSFLSFENFLEEILIDNMLMDKGPDSKVRSLVRVKNRKHAKLILLNGRSYFQPLPYKRNLVETASVFLKDGRPFTSATDAEIQIIEKARHIRNHIAHRSAETERKYRRQVLSQVTLPHSSLQPGYLLNSRFSITRSYFEHYVSELLGIAIRLAND